MYPCERYGCRGWRLVAAGGLLVILGLGGWPAAAADERAAAEAAREGSALVGSAVLGTTARLPVVYGVEQDPAESAAATPCPVPAGTAGQPDLRLGPGQAVQSGRTAELLGWELVDVDSFLAHIPAGQACFIRYDHIAGSLESLEPSLPLTPLAFEAVEYGPEWLARDLTDAFRRMDPGHQDLYAGLILGTGDPLVDEVAFVVAHTAPEVLESANFHEGLLTENAEDVYAHDAYLDYAEVLDYGSAALGGDYYSTLRYRTAAAGETLQVELPRERYYWDVVHPKITDEFPTYIDPATGLAAEPPIGRFWREFLFTQADSGCPVLRDQLAGCQVLWEGNVDSRTNGAVGIMTQWILDVMDFGSGAERPIQPVRIYRKHLGRCGEHADITAAAARAALVPTNSASTMENDHTWNEFWDRRWIAWEPVNVYIDAPWHYEGWGSWQFLGAFDWRGDDGVWTVTERYTPACTLTVAVTDSAGYPVDGAQVTIARKVDGITYLESTWGSTDHTGRCRFQLGDGQYVYARIDSDLGTVPPGPLYKLVVGPTVAGQHYLWQKTVPNLRPALPAEPGGPPVGQAAEYQVLVDWEVSDQFVYGSNRIDDNTFSDHLPLGALTSFVCDQAGYDAYLTWQPFLAYNLMRDSTSGSLTFEIPPGDDHYVVFSNQEHVASAQVVRGVAKLYYRSMADVAGGSVRSAEVSLGQVRPNPVAGETAILFSLPADAVADLSIYDVEGRWVNTLASGLTSAGEHRVCWDGRDSLGRRVAPGIYVCRLDSPRGRVSRKMVVVE